MTTHFAQHPDAELDQAILIGLEAARRMVKQGIRTQGPENISQVIQLSRSWTALSQAEIFCQSRYLLRTFVAELIHIGPY